MVDGLDLPLGISLSADIEPRKGAVEAHRARVRWFDPVTKRRFSKSETFATRADAEDWLRRARQLAGRGIDPNTAAKPCRPTAKPT